MGPYRAWALTGPGPFIEPGPIWGLIGPFKEVIGRSWACLGSAWLEPSSKPSLDTCIHLHLGYLRFHLEYLHSPSPSIFSLPSPGPLLTYIALTSIAYTMHFSLRLPSLPSHCPWMRRYMLHLPCLHSFFKPDSPCLHVFVVGHDFIVGHTFVVGHYIHMYVWQRRRTPGPRVGQPRHQKGFIRA